MSKPKAQEDLETKTETAKKTLSEKQTSLQDLEQSSKPIRRERGFVLEESQQIRTQIKICQDKIAELRLTVKVKEREAEEIEERTRTEIQVYKQKVKHQLHTQRNNLDQIDKDSKLIVQHQADEYSETIKRLESEAQRLSDDINSTQGNHAIQVKQCKDDGKNQISHFQEIYKNRLSQIDQEHQQNTEKLFEDYNLQRINELHEIQERKEDHIRRLMKSHKKSFQELKEFYNKLTQDHLSMISQFEAELVDMDNRYHDYELKKKSADQEIAVLKSQLEEKKKDNNNLHKTLSTYDSDKLALANSRARIANLEAEIESMEHTISAKETKFKKMEQEKEQLTEKFEASVHDVRQKTEFRALLLEKKVESLDKTLRKKEGQLEETLETAGLNEEQLHAISERVSDLLSAKTAVIENLEYELAKATKAHNDMINIYQAKLSAAGVPADELSFELRPTDTTSAPAPSLFH